MQSRIYMLYDAPFIVNKNTVAFSLFYFLIFCQRTSISSCCSVLSIDFQYIIEIIPTHDDIYRDVFGHIVLAKYKQTTPTQIFVEQIFNRLLCFFLAKR